MTHDEAAKLVFGLAQCYDASQARSADGSARVLIATGADREALATAAIVLSAAQQAENAK